MTDSSGNAKTSKFTRAKAIIYEPYNKVKNQHFKLLMFIIQICTHHVHSNRMYDEINDRLQWESEERRNLLELKARVSSAGAH